MKTTHLTIITLTTILFMTVACRTPDKRMLNCESSNTHCHEGCNEAMESYSQNLAPFQRINQCDTNCESYYQQCVDRVAKEIENPAP